MRISFKPSLHAILLAGLAATALTLTMGSLRDDYFWYTPDQLGYRTYLRGDYTGAAHHFQHPAWEAVACYRLGDYVCAGNGFAAGNDAIAGYNLGNAHARAGDLKAALESYQRALQQRSGWPAAIDNQRLVASLITGKNAPRASGDGDEPTQAADSSKIDDRGKRGKPGEVSIEKLDPKSLDKLWLRNVRTDPAAFLRLRFAGEAGSAQAPEGSAR